ncbi:hypothetical protein GGF32_006047 [Allomyces javanicus]|nr:hypothetical protein GGF32_006047 [Allomyces javanicus]
MNLTLREYRRILILKVVHRDERVALLSSSAQIDEVWHAHVLDTQAYKAMNKQLPFWIHHDPRRSYGETRRIVRVGSKTRTGATANAGAICRRPCGMTCRPQPIALARRRLQKLKNQML